MPDEIEFPQRDPADAKAWFYLDRRADIEAWAAQRDDAAALLGRYLRALATPLSEMAGEVDADVDLESLGDGKFQVMGLRRAGWIWKGVNDVAVVVEWDPKTLLRPLAENEWPFAAVRYCGDRADRERFRALQNALTPVAKRLGGRCTTPWPYWRFQKPAGGVVDPELLTRDLLASFRSLWDEAAQVLDRLHWAQAPR
ncbi:hypothetical protein ACLQ24_17155 [Micromonospora sp. DT4]|uniref:hypothetical protein n=1 Tax=Micromonospora sp. DT4 TaxID=3393438 RepID=UPI003CEC6007